MEGQQDQKGLFEQWRTRLSQALLREPAVVLLEREGDRPAGSGDVQPLRQGECVRIRSSF